MDNKIVLTGIQPTGTPHIGNYIGALKTLIDLSQNHKTIMFVADLHALNAVHDAKEIEQHTYCCKNYRKSQKENAGIKQRGTER